MVGLKKARLNKGNTNTLFDSYSEEEYEYDLAPIAPKCEKKWSWGTDVELFDTTGIGGNTNPGSAEALMQTLHLGWLFKPRKMKYGEFHITGSGECK